MSDDSQKDFDQYADNDSAPKQNNADDPVISGGPFSIVLPPDMAVWNEARRLASDKNVRVEDLAFITSQDPSLVIELLRIANAMYFSGGRPPITITQTAIVRLGSVVTLDVFDKISERQQIEDKEISKYLEMQRNRCRRNSILAKIISEVVAKQLSDECQTAGLLMFVGEMLAVAHFKDKYVKLAEHHGRNINYRLVQDFKFNPEKIGFEYLRRNGIPEAILFALQYTGTTKVADRAVMRPICFAAAEMLSAFDQSRWEKLGPGKKIPPKSPIRMLQINDAQYLKIYERASEFLYSMRMLDEKRRQASEPTPAAPVIEVKDHSSPTNEISSLEAEIQNLIHPEIETKQTAPKKEIKSTHIVELKTKLTAKDKEDFQLTKTVKSTQPRTKEEHAPKVDYALRTPKGNKVVSAVTSVFEDAKTSEELLSQIIERLITEGPFEKTALIVISQDRKSAIVVACRGPNITNGQKIVLDDPLSPLAACFSKVQSFGSTNNKVSPFGSKSYAVAPIDADHTTPVALYADCGYDGALTFEARRIFRTVVELLNQKLPQIPGGIPVELVQS